MRYVGWGMWGARILKIGDTHLSSSPDKRFKLNHRGYLPDCFDFLEKLCVFQSQKEGLLIPASGSGNAKLGVAC